MLGCPNDKFNDRLTSRWISAAFRDRILIDYPTEPNHIFTMNTFTAGINEGHERNVNKDASSTGSSLGLAVIGCEIAGVIGIIKALDMQNGLDVFLCLL